MQTFLPYPSFTHSLAVLDRARLGKQRIECRQLLTALRALRNGRSVGWSNHPAALMWVGYESALAVYMTLAIKEWVDRGYTNTMIAPYNEDWKRGVGEDDKLYSDAREAILPPWLGDAEFHASHRANLLRKDPEFYGKFGWTEDPSIEYIWPKSEKESEE